MSQETEEKWGGEDPIYNIGVVVRMVGVSEATLRVWERRYGFPEPTRTEGGHRLYTESQVRRLQWIKTQIDDGMRTRQAIGALRALERKGQVPEVPLNSPPPVQREVTDTSLPVFQAALTQALLSHDTENADQVLGEVLALYTLEELILEVVQPTLAEIGQAWVDGCATVATEHLTTHYLRHRLLAWMLTGPRPHHVRPIALACAPGEWHEGSLLILGTLLRRLRWPVVYLGQSVPLPDLAALVQDIRVPVIVFVAMAEDPAKSLAEWPRWFPDSARGGRPVITFGGLIFTEHPEWQEKVPGKFLGSTLQEGIETLDRLMRDVTAFQL